MSYKTIRAYLVARMAALQFSESNDLGDFQSDCSTGKYIIDHPESNSERPELNTGFFPQRRMLVKIAMKVTDSKSAVQDYSTMQSRIDTLVAQVCNPTNFQASAFQIRNLTYLRHTADVKANLVTFTIEFQVEDTLSYA